MKEIPLKKDVDQTYRVSDIEEEVSKIANGRYFSVSYERTVHSSGEKKDTYSLYIDGLGWTDNSDNPKSAVDKMRIKDGSFRGDIKGLEI